VVGVITGSGTYALPGFAGTAPERVDTPWGAAQVTHGLIGGAEALHVSRHGDGHARLSNHVEHRANVWALRELGAAAAIGCTACGAVDPTVALGSLVVFDDLHFIANRLPDGSICTFHDTAGAPARGHWILHGGPYSAEVRAAVLTGAAAAGHPARDGGCYGHVDGPRFNTPAEIASLAACGVTAVSQTGGPETVLAGEAELPYALVGFATDYANAVAEEQTPVERLKELMGSSAQVFAEVLARAVPALAPAAARPAGTMYRFG
jgi:5'-methylthioadenosine phosphorylase